MPIRRPRTDSTSGEGPSVLCDAKAALKLSAVLKHAQTDFRFYAQRIGCAVETMDPVELLARLPTLNSEAYLQLQKEVLTRLSGGHFIGDVSSGTSGLTKLRFTSFRDELAEARVCERFLRNSGLSLGGRVAAVDVGASDIYVFLGEILQDMGCPGFVFLTLPGSKDELRRMIARLDVLRVDTILTVPSAMARIVCLLEEDRSSALRNLKHVVMVGEPTSETMRAALAQRDIDVYSLFGTTETGWIGGECWAQAGVHLYSDIVVPTILRPHFAGATLSGEALWTTLHLRDQPLLNFSSYDFVTITTDRCVCGDASPRLLSVQRTTDQVVLYGHKVQYTALRESVERSVGHLEFMQLYVSRNASAYDLNVLLPGRLEPLSPRCYRAITSTDELGEFVVRGLLTIRIFWLSRPVTRGRKVPGVISALGAEELVVGVHDGTHPIVGVGGFQVPGTGVEHTLVHRS